jgi:hypothetical protein
MNLARVGADDLSGIAPHGPSAAEPPLSTGHQVAEPEDIVKVALEMIIALDIRHKYPAPWGAVHLRSMITVFHRLVSIA